MEAFFAAIGVIASVCGSIQFIIALRYDRNTQTFVKQDLVIVLREALFCALSAAFFGLMAWIGLQVAWTIISYILVFIHPISSQCTLSPPGGDITNCLASTALAPTANAIILVGASVAAALGGIVYLIGLAQKWVEQRRKMPKAPVQP